MKNISTLFEELKSAGSHRVDKRKELMSFLPPMFGVFPTCLGADFIPWRRRDNVTSDLHYLDESAIIEIRITIVGVKKHVNSCAES